VNDFGRRGCPRRFLNRPPPRYVYFPRSHFARFDRGLRSLGRAVLGSLVRSRKYTSNGPYRHTVRRISGEACTILPRWYRWVAGLDVFVVGSPADERIILLELRVGPKREGPQLDALSSHLFPTPSSRHLLPFCVPFRNQRHMDWVSSNCGIEKPRFFLFCGRLVFRIFQYRIKLYPCISSSPTTY